MTDESEQIKNFHDLKREHKALEKSVVMLVGWLAQSHVFGQHDFDAFVKYLDDEKNKEQSDDR